MIRTLQALIWLRWRLLTSGLRHSRRDSVQKLARTVGPVVKVLILLGLLQVFVVLIGLGVLLGWHLARQSADAEVAMVLCRVVLAATLLAVLARPFFPGGSSMDTAPRLLLLPIRHDHLRWLHYLAELLDPLLLAFVAPWLGLPLGLLLGGQPLAGLRALAGGALLWMVLAALGWSAGNLLRLLLLDRRRSERLLVVGFLLMISLLLSLNWLDRTAVEPKSAPNTVSAPAANPAAAESDRTTHSLALMPTLRQLARWLDPPGELWVLGVLGPARAALWPLLGLALLWLLSFRLAGRIHDRALLAVSTGHRGDQGKARWRSVAQPGLTTAASAVSDAQLRNLWRSVLGKINLLSVPLFIVLVGVGIPAADSGWRSELGLELQIGFVGLAWALTSLTTFSLNQLASDGPGLTQQALLPISPRDLLRGKARAFDLLSLLITLLGWVAGCAVATPAAGEAMLNLLILLLAWFIASRWMWPAGAFLSMMLPKKVDLSSLGSKGQPHQLANVLGLLLIALLLLIPATPLVLGSWLQSPRWAAVTALAVLALLSWLVVQPLWRSAETVWRRRQENILTVTQRSA